MEQLGIQECSSLFLVSVNSVCALFVFLLTFTVLGIEPQSLACAKRVPFP